MRAGPQREHEWLHKLVGEWTNESPAVMEPGKPRDDQRLLRSRVLKDDGAWQERMTARYRRRT